MNKFRHRSSDEQGETSIQAVLLLPVVMSLLFIGVHAASLAYGSHVAIVAASRGGQMIAATTTQNAGLVAGLNEIERVVHDLGAKMNRPPVVRINGKEVVVTVTLNVQRIVPFLSSQISRTAHLARERFVMEQDR